MYKKTTTGNNGLANQINYNFYYPCGGGSLNSSEEIFDYWKRTDYSYAISCREYPTFRAFLIKQTDGYELGMFFNGCNDKRMTFSNIICQRLTKYTKELIIGYMKDFLDVWGPFNK